MKRLLLILGIMMGSFVATGSGAKAEPEFVSAGLTWSPGPSASVRFGIGGVGTNAKGLATLLFVMPTQGSVGWETHFRAKVGDLLPYRGGASRVIAITMPDADESEAPGGHGHGGVTLQAVASSVSEPATDEQVVYLPEDGELVLPEAPPGEQNTVRVEAWLPDASRPFAAVVWWTYSYLSAGLAKPEDIHRMTVHAGADFTVGTRHLHVKAIAAKALDHPAWVEIALR